MRESKIKSLNVGDIIFCSYNGEKYRIIGTTYTVQDGKSFVCLSQYGKKICLPDKKDICIFLNRSQYFDELFSKIISELK